MMAEQEKDLSPSKSQTSTSEEGESTALVPDLESDSSLAQPPRIEESSAVAGAEGIDQAVPGTSANVLTRLGTQIAIKFRKITHTKKTDDKSGNVAAGTSDEAKDCKKERWWSRGKKAEKCKPPYVDSEESSVTESSMMEDSSVVAQSPLEKEFPDKPTLKEESSE